MPAKFDWHTRYQQQARWTRELREFLYPVVQLYNSHRILDVGCGTGALLEELTQLTLANIFGLDLNRDYLFQAYQNAPRSHLIQGNALHLPFDNHAFDLALCHFVLLWVDDPAQMVKEMKRVTQKDGYVLALAEPDYGGRIDYPASLAQLGQWQISALTRQGAHPDIGRRLAEIFIQAGFNSIQTGLLGGQWTLPSPASDWEGEWTMLESDLASIPDLWEPGALEHLKEQEQIARHRGIRILFVPTFYTWGKVN